MEVPNAMTFEEDRLHQVDISEGNSMCSRGAGLFKGQNGVRAGASIGEGNMWEFLCA